MSGHDKSAQELKATINALDRSQAVIEFDPGGNIIYANTNFLNTVGHDLDGVKGKNHKIFVDPEYADSPEYKEFWNKLRKGEFVAQEFKERGKDGREVWIQASYNPVMDMRGKVFKVVKYATDITDQKMRTMDYVGQIEAIGKSQAVIEFDMNGNILNANRNFLDTMEYQFDEIKGQHHKMFVAPQYAASPEYAMFWDRLRRGEFMSAEYQRFGKNGKEIWIQASYNPILDTSGKPFKVVKYATDITADKLKSADYAGQIEAIGKSQAVIEFDMDGNILNANQNFLNAMGYGLDEIKGKHHRIFVDPKYAASSEYTEFWDKLKKGEYSVSEYQRFGKGGKEIWIQASYNPILDMNGRPFKVVKYATDITKQMNARVEAGHKTTETFANIETVAGATEEMLASVKEISANMAKSQEAVNDIVHKNKNASELTARLQQNTKSMEGIVEIIRDISEQVNLLALNATIEAARAGEAGKGFAVVAGEVKSLANETAKATNQISEEISAIQSVAQDVVSSTDIISDATNSVSEYVNIIVAAVEEQTSVTHEITQNMQKIMQGVSSLDECIKQIASRD
ncbi:MAG: PAS domain-containing methyl-accepting chemotaxis protein [Alphaproteobacteria bacterium]|nr:PAS domain-containing methyl-accepting chemotaxis protein [Alphaproteobacteria bacterium]